MAVNLSGAFPFEPGDRVRLIAALGTVPAKTEAYLCGYEFEKDALTYLAIIRIQDDGPWGTVDLRVTPNKLEAIT